MIKKPHNKALGKKGEDLVANYLQELSYKIIERNWRIKLGEIDIIATKNSTIYFIEVKTRSNINYGYPSEAINYKKLQRMQRLSEMYMQNVKLSQYDSQILVAEVINQNINLIEV